MEHPRLVAIVSGMVASASAFIVVSRWSLLGTVAGAACLPVVYNVVSFLVTAGFDRTVGWVRLRARGEKKDAEPGQDVAVVVSEPDAQEGVALGSESGSTVQSFTRRRWGGVRPVAVQWVLGGFVLASLALNVYALTLPDDAEKSVETVIVKERLITVTTLQVASAAGEVSDSAEESVRRSSVPYQSVPAEATPADESTDTLPASSETTVSTDTPISTDDTEAGEGDEPTTTTVDDTGQESTPQPTTTTIVEEGDGTPPPTTVTTTGL